MDQGSLALALGAGTLAAVNPCGFALLPGYVTFLVADGDGEEATGRFTALRRALTLALAMTLGFTAFFGLFGLASAAALNSLTGTTQEVLPWVTMVMGVMLVGIGIWLVIGKSLPGLNIGFRGPAVKRSLPSMFLFGVGYSMASLSCTITPFLITVGTSFTADTIVDGAALFVAYAAGMGLVVGSIAITVALARGSLVGKLRSLGPKMGRIGGALLLVAGAYVAYYGLYDVRSIYSDEVVQDPIVEEAQEVRRYLADTIDSLGGLWLSVILGSLIALMVALPYIKKTFVRLFGAPGRADDGDGAAEAGFHATADDDAGDSGGEPVDESQYRPEPADHRT